MAFHLACPLTCRKICYCPFGNPSPLEAKREPVQIAAALANILASPYVAYGGEETVDVLVPCLPKDVKNKQKINPELHLGRRNAVDGLSNASNRSGVGRKVSLAATIPDATTKSEQVKKKTLDAPKLKVKLHLAGSGAKTSAKSATSVEGLARHGPKNAEDLLQPPPPQIVCGLCSSVEIIGKETEKRMLSCNGCKKKYHRKCVKHWAEFRDLFNWRTWVCGSCRSCEVCRRTGEPNKLMFCKRCDVALHVYCQQPPLKHVPKGPYLCPKHTHCHSCGSNVPGSGVSSKWFLAFTTCDACGRLFVKDKYCPVCLKVYRDSEATPMVCCDSCEHWVHCRCDGISEEKFNQFQTDDNLRYKCPACRGECHKVNSLDDAVKELWKRRDKADAVQVARLGAAVGLPPREENVCLSSDDEKHPVASTQVSHLSKKAFDTNTETKKKPKNDSLFSASTVHKHGGNVGKKLVLQRINLKRPRTSTEVDREDPNEERAFAGDSIKYALAALTTSREDEIPKATKQRIRIVDTGRARSSVS